MGAQKISLGNTDLEHRPSRGWRIYEEESRTLLVWHHLPPSVSSSRLWAENREDFLSFFFINLTFTGSSDAHGSTTTRRHLSPCHQRRKITKKKQQKNNFLQRHMRRKGWKNNNKNNNDERQLNYRPSHIFIHSQYICQYTPCNYKWPKKIYKID